MNHLHSSPIESLFNHFQTDAKGLEKNEVSNRLQKYGLNQLAEPPPPNKWRIFINQFKSFLIYVLCFAVVLSFALGEYADGIAILIILILNALIGFFQELRAEKSLQALRQMNRVMARVLRDGDWQHLEASQLVPGDIVELEAGDRVPADLRLIAAGRCLVEEAALTGESLPQEKQLGDLPEDTELALRSNMLFMGTSQQAGFAKALVVATGKSTQIGRIATLLSNTKEGPTPLQRRLDRFGKLLSWATLLICVLVFMVMAGRGYLEHGTFRSAELVEAMLSAVALAVAVVPEGLPAIVTIALAVGVRKLLQEKALVRRLAAVETLGSCTVVCSDKTGTLTENQMTVRNAWTLAGEVQLSGVGYALEGVVHGAVLPLLFLAGRDCNHASLHVEPDSSIHINGDPTEAALLISAQKTGLSHLHSASGNSAVGHVLDELPFDSDRKCMSNLIEYKVPPCNMPDLLQSSRRLILAKGAPAELLDICSSYLDPDHNVSKLNDAIRAEILAQVSHYSNQALRVLAFATRPAPAQEKYAEENLIFIGLQAMIDPPRTEVLEAIKETRAAGLRVIMITGDQPETARAIGHELGIKGDVISGKELDTLSEDQLVNRLHTGATIFARVVPEHKQRIIQALEEHDEIVAMTGDGVNDAPALKQADVGVALGSGTDVAKEAADIVLLNDSFATITHAIREGRGIYENIQKAIMHLLSGNLSEVLIIFIGVLLGMDLPLTALMLLYINLVSDGAPALALAVDPIAPDIMRRKPRPAGEPILPRRETLLVVLMGLTSTAIGLALFAFGTQWPGLAESDPRTLLFTFLVFSELVLLMVIRRYSGVAYFSNPLLWLSIVLIFLLQIIILYTPVRNYFALQILNPTAIAYLIMTQILLFAICTVYRIVLRRENIISLPEST